MRFPRVLVVCAALAAAPFTHGADESSSPRPNPPQPAAIPSEWVTDPGPAATEPTPGPTPAPPANQAPAPPANQAPAPPPSASAAAPAQPAPAQPTQAPAGQWVFTQQYGWIWMPYGDTYTYVPTYSGGEPYQYVYSVGIGWSWVAAPWIWGYGPWPWFGVAGPWAFAWYGWGFWSYPYHSYGYRPGYAFGYRGPGFSPAGAVRPGAPVAAPVGVGGMGYAPSGGGHGGGGFSPRGAHR